MWLQTGIYVLIWFYGRTEWLFTVGQTFYEHYFSVGSRTVTD